MYSRLYTNVLNIHHAVDYCASFHHCYADSGKSLIKVAPFSPRSMLSNCHPTGLFGIAASVSPHFTSRITDIIAAQLDQLTRPMRGGVTENELKRAKNQLKSSLVMALESRSVEVEGKCLLRSELYPIQNKQLMELAGSCRSRSSNPNSRQESARRGDVREDRCSNIECKSTVLRQSIIDFH